MTGKLGKALALYKRDPRLLSKKLLHMVGLTRRPRSELVRKTTDGVDFEFDFTYDGPRSRAYEEAYLGIYEPFTVLAMKSILRPGDVFIDVGANVGILTAAGAALVGKAGQVHSFEPVPEYFEKLELLAQLNPDFSLTVNPYALGEKPGTCVIHVVGRTNVGWNTLIPELIGDDLPRHAVEAQVVRLDDYIERNGLREVALIKIDAEGFEYPVLKGLSGYLENPEYRPPVLCEIVPQAYALLGHHIQDLREYMEGYGYHPVSLVDLTSEVNLARLIGLTNILFITGSGP
jgi:FkbM family methyltransferase